MNRLIPLGLLAAVLLLAGCSASVPIRPTSFFLLQNDRTGEPVKPEKAITEPSKPTMPDVQKEDSLLPG